MRRREKKEREEEEEERTYLIVELVSPKIKHVSERKFLYKSLFHFVLNENSKQDWNRRRNTLCVEFEERNRSWFPSLLGAIKLHKEKIHVPKSFKHGSKNLSTS